MTQRLHELAHIEMRRVAVSFAQARSGSRHGTYASLTPMRFEAGSLYTDRRRRRYTVQRLFDPDGVEMLYILTFYLPRFMDIDLGEKLTTVLHELWHISPRFDGDIRRHPGRCYAHSRSQKEYDVAMADLARRWIALSPPEDLFAFLAHDFHQLRHLHGSVHGTKIRHPKLIPCK
jgi:hypothetical protein